MKEHDMTAWPIPHPVPKFWRVPLSGEQSNPGSRQYIYQLPDSRTAFGQIPNPDNALPDPVLTLYFVLTKNLIRSFLGNSVVSCKYKDQKKDDEIELFLLRFRPALFLDFDVERKIREEGGWESKNSTDSVPLHWAA